MKLSTWFEKERLISKLNRLFKKNKFNEIIELSSKALDRGIQAPELYTFQIWSLLELKQNDKAKEIVDKALTVYSDLPIFLSLSGEISYRLDQFEQAHPMLLKALEVSPGNLQVEYLLGLNHVAQGQLEEAAEYFDSILRYDPTLLQTRLLAVAERQIFMTRKERDI